MKHLRLSILLSTTLFLLAGTSTLAAAKIPGSKDKDSKTEQQSERASKKEVQQERRAENQKKKNQPAPVTAIPFSTAPKLKLTPKSLNLQPAQTATLSIDKSEGDASKIKTWSSDPTVVSISDNGTITARSPGRAMLSVRLGEKFATIPVSITQPLPADYPETDNTHPVDAAVNKNLRTLGIAPSPLCTDAEFLRRACLDLMGTLPTPEQVRKFTKDESPDKRAKLVDWIFQQEEYADFWANKWADLLRVKSEFPSNLWPNAVQAYHTWIRDSVVTNKPYDQFATELICSAGSNFRAPAVNFYRAFQKRTPNAIAESVAMVFMGVRLSCTKCTEHPFETWPQAWANAYSNFFTNIKYKRTDEWKEEIVYYANWVLFKDPDTNKPTQPFLPGIGPIQISFKGNPQEIFSKWLTAPKNPYFAKHIANRYWSALLGHGITIPVDDVRPNNPPSNPELLNTLAKRLVDNKYDLQDLIKFIVTSQTYQRSSLTNPSNKTDIQNFSHYLIRRLDAEVLADAIGNITGKYESFSSRIPEPYSFWPSNFHSLQNPDGSVTTPFLENFGRPGRDSSLESERDRNPSLAQALYLLNSDTFLSKLNHRTSNIPALSKRYANDTNKLINECYLLTLSRPPTDKEKSAVCSYFEKHPDKNQYAQSLLWALFNTKEFLFNH